MWRRTSAHFFVNLRKIGTFERETGKTGFFYMILAQFDKNVKGFTWFLWHSKAIPLLKMQDFCRTSSATVGLLNTQSEACPGQK